MEVSMTQQTEKINKLLPSFAEFEFYQKAIDEQMRLLEEEKKDLSREFYSNEKRRILEQRETLNFKRTKVIFRISALTEELCKKDVHYVSKTLFDEKKKISNYTMTHSAGKTHYEVNRCRCCGKVTSVIEDRCKGKHLTYGGLYYYDYEGKYLPDRSFSDFATAFKMETVDFHHMYDSIRDYLSSKYPQYYNGSFINTQQNDVRSVLEMLKEALEERFAIEADIEKQQKALEQLCSLFGHDIDEEVLINDQSGTCKCCGKTIETSEYIEQCQYAQYFGLLK